MVLDDYELKNYPAEHANCKAGIDYFLQSIEGKCTTGNNIDAGTILQNGEFVCFHDIPNASS
jgi:hypothetical protein